MLERNIACGDVFFGCFEKPLPYFFPFIEVLERAIKAKSGVRAVRETGAWL